MIISALKSKTVNFLPRPEYSFKKIFSSEISKRNWKIKGQ